jgi:hypothetical protein
MRVSRDRRLTGLIAAAAVALSGCDGKPKGTGGGGEMTGSAGVAVATAGQTPRQAADEFLKDLGEGKVDADRLTGGFNRKLAPKPARPDEGSPRAGFVPADVHNWLGAFKGATFVVGEETRVGNAIVLRGRARFPDKPMAFTLRMVKDGDLYKADWLHRSDRQGSEVKAPADPDLAAAQDVVRNFLDVLLGGDLKQARLLMAPAWRARLSPPSPADVRGGLDYGPGFLDGKLRSWRSDHLGYTLTTGELGSNKAAATFNAELQAGGQNVRHAVTAIKDPASGEWLVSDFERQ